MNKDLESELVKIRNNRGDYTIDLSMPLEYILALIKMGTRDLVLCDAGRHSSCEVVREVIEVYKVPALSLRGGLTVIDDQLPLNDYELTKKLKKILRAFPHISATWPIQHCYNRYERATDFLVRECNDFSGFESTSAAVIGIMVRNLPLK